MAALLSPLAGLALALPLLAPCLWDRDTLRVESEGAPGMVDLVTGRFDRFPPEYYESRLERVVASLGEPPYDLASIDLALLDDAGVACDRLHRGDEALRWMETKRTALDARPRKDPFHEYTFLANAGTFHVHRWLRADQSRDDMGDVERARDLIAAAIKLNPDAHFGRERYQLMAIQWLLEPVSASEEDPMPTLLDPVLGSSSWHPRFVDLETLGIADAAEGLAGLVRLGNAWESPAIWAALTAILSIEGDASLARLAARRVVEISDGRPGAVPFVGWDRARFLERVPSTLEEARRDELDAWFPEARASADAWRASRNGYLVAKIAEGNHPDSDPAFWDGWEDDIARPAFPGEVAAASPLRTAAVLFAVAALVLLLARRRRAARTA